MLVGEVVISLDMLLLATNSTEPTLSRRDVSSPSSSALRDRLILVERRCRVLGRRGRTLTRSVRSRERGRCRFIREACSRVEGFVKIFLFLANTLVIFFGVHAAGSLGGRFRGRLGSSQRSLKGRVGEFRLRIGGSTRKGFLGTIDSTLNGLRRDRNSLQQVVGLRTKCRGHQVKVFNGVGRLRRVSSTLRLLRTENFMDVSEGPVLSRG